ncbi:DUF1700 domain-containing protein [Undibacterium sp. Jales W-56]|uniref:DUF1700 domain-containing protein n=1 Tax=Undibacterium sp. Jales W-56 TaxID=2897325 RepID=UPI0021CFD069|nr:DUF1700 domain-containing protein [Undibacterium sp. Jales W-56]MCU6434060.1 DUF1700 domain-containing protein [Undibacterium sp. Jales W-56]
MNKADYMNSLKQALQGLPASVMEETMWDYEAQFVNALVAGRTEEQVAASLPAPQLVAAQKRNKLRLEAFKQQASPANLAGLFVSLIGVMVFNFFMIIPAMVYASMLFTAFIASMTFYVMGIVITAGSLSGIEHFKVNLPSHHYHATMNDEDEDLSIRSRSRDGFKVDISSSGIVVEDQESASANSPANAAASASAASATSSAEPVAVATMAGVKVASASITTAAPGRVEVNVENKLRHYNALQGIGILLGGIALFLLSLLMTRYTFVGFKNYLQWNISLLRLPVNA